MRTWVVASYTSANRPTFNNMERFRPEPPKEQLKKPYFTVYCQDEERFIYKSPGLNIQIEWIIARETAFEHANQLGHTVYIFEQGKKIV